MHTDQEIEELKIATAAEFGVTVDDLNKESRQEKFVRPRHVAMYLARTLLTRSFPQIGSAFLKDHTSAMHAKKSVTRHLERDPYFKLRIDRIIAAMPPPPPLALKDDIELAVALAGRLYVRKLTEKCRENPETVSAVLSDAFKELA